ncbi:MAG: SDR family NAD(P)-dependent oxidoreductase, partial [Armatimonadota bacterium]|nr:SDR family NAD(P)-dependent oxidoreductase [Armatimonadota bacterium]
MKLKEKCAVVTGAQQGIGRGIALAMASEGAAVVVADINPDKSQAVVAEIESKGGKSRAILCDVMSKEQVENLFDETIRTFGKVD